MHVLRSQVKSKNKIQAVNTSPDYQIPCWDTTLANKEIEATDIKLDSVSLQAQHPNRKEGGWGLLRVRTTIRDETKKIHEYTRKMAMTDHVLIVKTSGSSNQRKRSKKRIHHGRGGPSTACITGR